MAFVWPAAQLLPREGFMMTSAPRFVPVLCAAVVLFLLAGTLRAGGDLLQTVEVSGAHAQDNQGPPDNEIVAFNVCVPKTSAALETSASLLFLQPGSGNLMYGTLVNPFPFLSPHWGDQEVRPGFSPAFNVGMRYIFDSGGDIQLDWTHLNTYDSASAQVTTPYTLGQTSGSPSIQALGPPFLIGPPVPYASANAVAHFAYDAVNLEAELLRCIGSHVQVDLRRHPGGAHQRKPYGQFPKRGRVFIVYRRLQIIVYRRGPAPGNGTALYRRKPRTPRWGSGVHVDRHQAESHRLFRRFARGRTRRANPQHPILDFT